MSDQDLTDLYGSDDTDISKKGTNARTTRSAKPTDRIERTRGRRTSINAPQQRLAVLNTIPGYHLCWTNDEDNRIEFALDAGYEFVNKAEVGMARSAPVPTNNDVGDRVRQWVGTKRDNSPLYAYLMKIPEDWHREDLAIPHDKAQETLRAIHKGRVAPGANGESGSVENVYVPQGGIEMKESIVRRER